MSKLVSGWNIATLGLLTFPFAFGGDVGMQSTFPKHCITWSSELEQKPIKEELKPIPLSSCDFTGSVTKVSVCVSNGDNVQTPPTQYCFWDTGVYRRRLLSVLMHT